jgi:hypothetical protein
MVLVLAGNIKVEQMQIDELKGRQKTGYHN